MSATSETEAAWPLGEMENALGETEAFILADEPQPPP
jgi:hypothetical protein